MFEIWKAPRAALVIPRMMHGTAAALLALAMGASGCIADEPTAPTVDPLRQVDIPADFTFAMTRGALVELEFAERFMIRQPLTVELLREDGQLLYRGGVPASGRMQARLLLPRGDGAVRLHVTGRRGLDETVDVEITGVTVAMEVE